MKRSEIYRALYDGARPEPSSEIDYCAPAPGSEVSPPYTFLSVAHLERMLGVSSRTIWRWRQEGTFPNGYKVGRAVRWRSDEIKQWMDERPELA